MNLEHASMISDAGLKWVHMFIESGAITASGILELSPEDCKTCQS